MHKLKRTTASSGISPSWVLLGLTSNIGWLAYRWAQELWLGVPSPAIAAVLYAVTFSLVRNAGPDVRPGRIVAAGWAVCLVIGGTFGGWLMFGTLLGLSAVMQSAPSMWAAFRCSEPSGIAPGLWAIGLGQALLWGNYGLAHGDHALILYGVVTSLTSIAILARYWYTRRLADRGWNRQIEVAGV